MPLDLVLRQGRLTGKDEAPLDIGVADGRIVDIAPHIVAQAPEQQLDGRLVIPGFVETHIHLDKSCILERCNCERGTLEEAIETVAAAKRSFTEADIHARAQRTLEKAIIQGTTRMTRGSGSTGFTPCGRSSATTHGRSTCRSACSRRKA